MEETKHLFGLITEWRCVYYVPLLQLFIIKRVWQSTYWGIGRDAGDGCFAIRTPWFLWYLE